MKRWSIAVFVEFDRHHVLRPAIQRAWQISTISEGTLKQHDPAASVVAHFQQLAMLTTGLGLENGNWHYNHSKAQRLCQFDRRVIPSFKHKLEREVVLLTSDLLIFSRYFRNSIVSLLTSC